MRTCSERTALEDFEHGERHGGPFAEAVAIAAGVAVDQGAGVDAERGVVDEDAVVDAADVDALDVARRR